MRKLLLSLFILCGLSVVSNAQTAGKFWIGGSMSIKSSKVENFDRTTSYSIAPEVGYHISDSWAVGMGIGYKHLEDGSYDPVLGEVLGKYDGFTVNPFVRYSFLKGSIGNLFVDGGVSYS